MVDRVCAYQSNYPYITGLLLLFAGSPANVDVGHKERPVGGSNYNWTRIAGLVARILGEYGDVTCADGSFSTGILYAEFLVDVLRDASELKGGLNRVNLMAAV